MNLLVTGAWQGFSDCKEGLEQAGHEIVFMQWEKDELPCEPEWVEGIIGNGIFLSHPIEQFTNLKYIQLTSAGFDRVPMDYVKEHDIEIHNARGVYSIPMAEFAVSGVLQLYKKSAEFAKSQQVHEWRKLRDVQELNGRIVYIVGCGSVGTECAKRFQAFGCRVIGFDVVVSDKPYFERINQIAELENKIPDADVVVLTVPLTKDTKNLMNRDKMLRLKKRAILVNIARGGVLDYQAFCDLKLGTGSKDEQRFDIRGVFDVFESEPLSSDSPLWDLDGVIITPHNSFVGDNDRRLDGIITGNLEKINVIL